MKRKVAKDRNRIVPLLRTSRLSSPLRAWLRKAALNGLVLAAALALVVPRLAHAEAHLLIEADTGKVLEADNATVPWYPASLSKIMTAYVTLRAVKDGKIALDTLFTVSPLAASQSPSKMGFKPGTQVTVDNALKMMLVKSANDMAVVLAEGVGGSIDGFSAMMNDAAQKLGMTQTSYVNPNGLPADGQITSARDLGILARAFLHDLPEYEYFIHIPAIRYGKRVTQKRARQDAEIARRGDLAVGGQSVGIDVARLRHAELLRGLVHHRGETVDRTADALGEHHGHVVRRLDHHHLQRVVDGDLRAGTKAHLRGRLRSGGRRNREQRVERELAVLDRLQRDVSGHDLGDGSGIPGNGRVLGLQDLAAVGLDQEQRLGACGPCGEHRQRSSDKEDVQQ